MTKYSRKSKKCRKGGRPITRFSNSQDNGQQVDESQRENEEKLYNTIAVPDARRRETDVMKIDTRSPEQISKEREQYLIRKRYDEFPNRIERYGRQGQFTRIDEGDLDNDYYTEEDWKNDDNFVDYDNDEQKAGRKKRKTIKRRKTTKKRKTNKKRITRKKRG
jgi:hypothetical protein